MIYKIQPQTMYYAWGSPDRVGRLFGIENPGGRPIAELWYGSHERGPSLIQSDDGAAGGTENLRELLLARGRELLGEEVFQRYGQGLPFLFKILSADKGLSIQAHPNKTQAEAGFARENEQGIDIKAAERNYRDSNHKPECMVALEDFWALSGFRKPGIIAENLRQAGDSAPLRQLLGILKDGAATGGGALKEFYSTLMQPAVRQAVLEGALGRIRADGFDVGDAESCWYWVQELERQFPGDPGCLAPLYLNLIHMKPGEALFMDAGILHAYLRGTGLEIMANSDNVLRGGCTVKHVDVPELLSVLSFSADDPIRPQRSEAGWYESFVPEFSIAWMGVSASRPLELRAERGLGRRLAIILMIKGGMQINSGGQECVLQQGEAVFVPAAEAALNVSSASGAAFALATVNTG